MWQVDSGGACVIFVRDFRFLCFGSDMSSVLMLVLLPVCFMISIGKYKY